MKGNIRCEHCAWMSYRVLILPGSFTEVHITSGVSDRSIEHCMRVSRVLIRSLDFGDSDLTITRQHIFPFLHDIAPGPMSVNKFEECMTSSSQTLNAVVCPGWTRAKIDKWKTSGMEWHVMYSRGRQLPTPYRLDA